MTTITVRATRFTLDAQLDQPADLATMDVGAATAFQQADPAAALTLRAGYVQDGVSETLDLIVGGTVDSYIAKVDVQRGGSTRLTGQVKARDAMASLLDTEYRLVYRNGPTPAVTDGSLQVPEVNGLFTARQIAEQITVAAGLRLHWECPDYTVLDSFQAVGRPLDLIRNLIRPFSLLEAIKTDVFTVGSTLYVRHRDPLRWTAAALNTFSVGAGKISSVQVRKFRTDLIGLVSLQGARRDVPDPNAPDQSSKPGDGSTVPVLTWPEPPAITWPTALSAAQLDARANVPGVFEYSPAEGVSPDPGTVTLSANFYPDDPQYKSGTVKTTLVVNKIPVTISWPAPDPIDDSTSLSGTELDAASLDPESNPVPGTFRYRPDAGTILAAGTYTLTVTFHPSDSTHYADASGSTTLVVTGTPPAKTPVITWSDPAGIVEGEALSGTQLNATATDPITLDPVDGTFAYNPDAGTVLAAGTRTLRLHFTPTDTGTYAPADASVAIVVTRIRITWSPAKLTQGDPLGSAQLNAAANVPGAFDYAANPAGTVETEVGILVLSTTFTATASGPAPISHSAALRVVEAGTSSTPDGGSPTQGLVVITDTAGGAGGSVLTTLTYREPGDLLIAEDSSTVLNAIVATGVFGALGGGFSKIHHRDLEWEPSVVGSGGLLANQPRQLAEFLHEASITADRQTVAEQKTYTKYVHDDPAKDPRGLLNYEEEVTWKAELHAATGGALMLSGFPSLTLAPDRMTVKRYRDRSPGFYSVATEAYLWNAAALPDGQWEFDPGSSDVTVSQGTRPGGINSQGGSVPLTGDTGTGLVPQVSWFDPADIVWPTAIDATQLDATADVDGDFRYAPDVGTVLEPGPQKLLAIFTPADPAYKAVTATASLTVTKAEPVITWANPADIVHGTALSGTQQNATADVPGSFEYRPATGTVLTAGSHTLKVTFTPDDGQHYVVVTATVTILVTGVPPANDPVINWAAPGDINEGVALSGIQLNASVVDFSEEPIPGTTSYSPPAGTVLPAGTHVLHVFFQPDDDATWKSASDTVTIQVVRPGITWRKPSDVTVGTALDDAQLNATSNVDGEFVYNPPAGAIMGSVGTTTLNVTFTPADGGAALLKSVDLRVVADPSGGNSQSDRMKSIYTALQFRVDPDPTAPPIDLSDANLDQAALELIGEQLRGASGLWQWELSLQGVNMPWLRRGDVFRLTGLTDETGADIILPACIVQGISTVYDPVGQHAYTKTINGLGWSQEAVLTA